ncbi:glycoside hydrolase family 76 protein [Monashia sp. NPDC004114]
MPVAPGSLRLDVRAAAAERSVTTLFGSSLLRMPFTHLGRIASPAPRSFGGIYGTWNYWWQAHYLDVIVDAGLRALRHSDQAGAARRVRTGDRLTRTVRLRNGLRWTNAFYDDMAWMVLATGRLAQLHATHDVASGRGQGPRRLGTAERDLTAALRSAITDDLAGGLFWSTDRDFKNVPATGPAALHLARLGETALAQELVDWIYARLWSADSGLFLDGIRIAGSTEQVVPDVWTYNQGTVLGALVTLGDPESLGRASDLVAAVDDRLTTQVDGIRLLRTHGGGDGGLFTGILARYLALAASTSSLDAKARDTAARLVRDTADAFWQGREERDSPSGRHGTLAVFSTDPARPARDVAQAGGPVELSTQLQAWTTLEAAASLG